jgi:ATP-dependent Clp protease ATP-binding subunit ClpA
MEVGPTGEPNLLLIIMLFSQELLSALQDQIVGQEYAVTALTRAVVMALTGMYPRNGPLAVLMFAGPTGSGKTHVARSLAQVLFGNDGKIVHINCQRIGQSSDPFFDFHQQLSTGYFHYTQMSPYGKAPISILLFEELDKAPASFRHSLASALDWGRILSQHWCLSLRGSLIILTITLSKKQVDQFVGRTIGFFSDGEPGTDLSRRHILVLDEMDQMIGSQLVSRTDEIILFERLADHHITTLLERNLAGIEQFFGASRVAIIVNDRAKEFLLRQGLEDLSHGMRQVGRVIKNLLEFPLADLALSGRLFPGATVLVSHEPPRMFLNFQIMTPWLMPPDSPLFEPVKVEQSSIG